MKRVFFLLAPILLGALLFGCSQSTEPEAAPRTPAHFAATDDPHQFVDAFLDDLAGERYLPHELYERLRDRAQLPRSLDLMQQHDSLAFLRWYFANSFLSQLEQQTSRVFAEDDYRLKVMGMTKADADKVVLLVESGIANYKEALEGGRPEQDWTRLDDGRFEVLLTRGTWVGKLGVTKEDGQLKLVPLRAAPAPAG